jgi:competence protein ComEA
VEPASAPWRILETPGDTQPGAGPPPEPTRPPVPWAAAAAGAVALILAIGAFLLASQPEVVVGVDGAGAEAPGEAGPGEAPDDAGDGLVVEVSGAVARPGLYTLPTGARVADAIAAAGGYGPRVDAGAADLALNLAAGVRDGEKIRVPSRDDTPGGPPASGATGTGRGDTGHIDVNAASASELDTLPGVGPATAAKIIAAREERPFATVQELLERKVVGAATFEKLRDLVTAGP